MFFKDVVLVDEEGPCTLGYVSDDTTGRASRAAVGIVGIFGQRRMKFSSMPASPWREFLKKIMWSQRSGGDHGVSALDG